MSRSHHLHGHALISVLAISALLFGLCGCSKKPPSKPVPEMLNSIESIAEDIYDAALLGKNAAVREYAANLKQDWASFKLKEPDVLSSAASTVRAMDEAVSNFVKLSSCAANRALLARGANAVSASLCALFALYTNVIPPEVMVLDCLGREIVLDGMESDFSRAYRDYQALSAAWDKLRPLVKEKGGNATAFSYEKTLKGIHDAISSRNAGKTISEANMGLETVDSIEKLFEKAM